MLGLFGVVFRVRGCRFGGRTPRGTAIYIIQLLRRLADFFLRVEDSGAVGTAQDFFAGADLHGQLRVDLA